MRLVDADAFERAVMFSDDKDIQDVIYRLRDFPTIEERKTGKWEVFDILDYGRPTGRKVGKCPFCGYLTGDFRSMFESQHKLTNFCPNCGNYNGGKKND